MFVYMQQIYIYKMYVCRRILVLSENEIMYVQLLFYNGLYT
jgi:hypothetical protein